MTSEAPRVLSVTEAAEVLGIHRDTAYRLIAAGEFPVRTLRIGRQIRVPSVALDAYLSGDEGRSTGAAPG